jgi:hypothetical protein
VKAEQEQLGALCAGDPAAECPECFHGSDCVCKAAELTPPVTPPHSPSSGPSCDPAAPENKTATALALLVKEGHSDLRVQADFVVSAGCFTMELALAPFSIFATQA